MRNLRGLSFVLLLVFCLCCSGCSGKNSTSDTPAVPCEYDQKLFTADKVHTVDVTISDSDWNDLMSRPMEKIKYAVDVTIDGESFRNVSFSTKGNSSLSAVAFTTNNGRFSYKINFGKFEKGQTYYGLNKLHLNSLYGDATHMKDYISYELFRRAGVCAPLISYVWLSVNKSPIGLYIAVEDMSGSFRKRALKGEGFLYKPECDQTDFSALLGPTQPPAPGADSAPSGQEAMPSSPFQGADLMYIDENIESYPGIFNHTETKAADADKLRVISALKGFMDRRNPDEFLDTVGIIRYFAAHNFVLNGDSYTGNIPTNYILYEHNGKLAMLPWDYNLAFGAFPTGMPGATPGSMADMQGMALGGVQGMAPGGIQGPVPAEEGGNQSANPAVIDLSSEGLSFLLNTGIDTPLPGIPDMSRPLWAWILSNDYFKNQYHNAMDSLISKYFESGDFEKQVDSLYQLLLPYAEKDPTAFYSAEEFTKACEVFKQFCRIRAQSIRAQLNGTLSTSTATQDAADQIDATGLDMEALGTPVHDAPAGPASPPSAPTEPPEPTVPPAP